MSRLDRDKQVPNPAEIWLEWSSDKKCFTYYDKEFDGSDKNRPVKKLRFLVLEEVKSVRGFHKAEECSIISNQVLDITDGILKVRNMKKDHIATGTWAEIKSQVTGIGGKFSTDIYAMLETKSGFRIVCICMYGAALGGWIEFAKECYKNKKTTGHGVIEFAGSRPEKMGKVDYEVPLFVQKDASEEEDNAAMEQAKLLKEFFNAQKMTVQQIPTAADAGYKHEYAESQAGSQDGQDMLQDESERLRSRQEPTDHRGGTFEEQVEDEDEQDDLPF